MTVSIQSARGFPNFSYKGFEHKPSELGRFRRRPSLFVPPRSETGGGGDGEGGLDSADGRPTRPLS